MKRRTRFRGDLQVDGQILGSDGQPIGGGGAGAIDWATPIPELHFAGDPTDDSSGMSIAWDEDLWGLAFRQPLGADDAEIYLVSSDNPDTYLNLYPGGLYTSYETDRAHLGGWGLDLQDHGSHILIDNGMYNRITIAPAVGSLPIDNGALMISRPGDSGSLNMISFALMHDGAMGWGPGGYVPRDTHLTRTAPGTLEIDNTLAFKGDASDATSGATIAWDQGLYGLALRGRPGSFDGELYTIDSDVDDRYGNLYPGGLQVHNGVAAGGGFAYLTPQQMRISNDDGHIAILAPDELILDTPGAFIQALSPDGTAYKLTPPNGGGPAEWVAA